MKVCVSLGKPCPHSSQPSGRIGCLISSIEVAALPLQVSEAFYQSSIGLAIRLIGVSMSKKAGLSIGDVLAFKHMILR